MMPKNTSSLILVPQASKELSLCPSQLTLTSVISMPFDQEIPDEMTNGKILGTDTKKNYYDNISTGASLSSVTTDTESSDNFNRKSEYPAESCMSTTVQISLPFFLAGIGTIGAGIILGIVQNWQVFLDVKELFILVPALLGLKGNLDMCLASRLSTQSNIGNMKNKREIFKMITGNLAIVQVQAIVASFLVSLFAASVGALMTPPFDFKHVMLLSASSVLTATISCLLLDLVLISVILISRVYNWNPDNVATPFAASIGDCISIFFLSNTANFLYKVHETHYWIMFVIMAIYLCLLPVWILVVLKNKYTRPVLTSGWIPVLGALFISSLGGLVLGNAVEKFVGFVVFQPIINGIGGNLVSVQSSRISTMLHQTSLPGILPPHTEMYVWPWKALFKGVPSAKTARILICMSIPGQILFLYTADFLQEYDITIEPAFVFSYLTASTVQIMLLLYIAHLLTHRMWLAKIDPDNSSIPFLTALGDLFGTLFLLAAFYFLQSVGYDYGV